MSQLERCLFNVIRRLDLETLYKLVISFYSIDLVSVFLEPTGRKAEGLVNNYRAVVPRGINMP